MFYVDHTNVQAHLSMLLYIKLATHLLISLQNQTLSLTHSSLDTQIVSACISSLLPQCLYNLAFDKQLAAVFQILDFPTINIIVIMINMFTYIY